VNFALLLLTDCHHAATLETVNFSGLLCW